MRRDPGMRHPDRQRRHRAGRAGHRVQPWAELRGRGGGGRERDDRAAGPHRCAQLHVADGASRLCARPVDGQLLHPAVAAAALLSAGRQLQFRLCRRPRDAFLWHDDGGRLLPQHPRARLCRRCDRGAARVRHPARLHLLVHERIARRLRQRGRALRGCAAGVRALRRSGQPHHGELRHRIDRDGERGRPARVRSCAGRWALRAAST